MNTVSKDKPEEEKKLNTYKGGTLSPQAYYKLAVADDVPSIQRVSSDQIKKFNELIVKINQHPNYKGQKLDRNKIASTLGVKIGDLNTSLQVTAPINSCNNIVRRSINYMENIYKHL